MVIRPDNVRRVCFASKLFPRLATSLGVDTSRLIPENQFDGEVFFGGRSKNKDLLSFFGLLSESQRGASTYVQLPLFRRSVKKLINLVETELEKIGALEVLLPTLIPKKLWNQSKRVERQNDAYNNVYQLTDRVGNDLLLGPTFEESITQLIGDLKPLNEHELPLLFYQTSQKYRFEPNPRFGLLRSNEFLMNDMYSFDSNLNKARQTYDRIGEVYEKIFNLLGLKCLKVENDPGAIGGIYSHEYQLPVSSGEDLLIRCKSCDYACNSEFCKGGKASNSTEEKCIKCNSSNIERIQALELGHTFMLSDTYSRPFNITIKGDDGLRRHYEMGCYGLGLTRILGAALDLFSVAPRPGQRYDEGALISQIRWPNKVEPFKFGIVTPAKRSKQYQSGSSRFVERLINRILDTTDREVDIIIEDREKDGILKRLTKIQCLGVPNIIVVGKRFLDDPPHIEVLKLSADKQKYEQNWFNEEQLFDYIKRET